MHIHNNMWICIGVVIRGLSWSIVVYGGLALQIQSLKLNGRSFFLCIVFESIRPLCAQYLRNNSGVDALVRRAQRAAEGAEGLGFSAD